MVRRPIDRMGPRTVTRFGRPVTVTNATLTDNVSDAPTSEWDERNDSGVTTTETTARIEQTVEPDEHTDQRGEVSEADVTIWLLTADVAVYSGGESTDRKATRVTDTEAQATYEVRDVFYERNGLARALAAEV